MAIPVYQVGTATLTAGSKNMVGQGTLWVGNVRQYDQVIGNDGRVGFVDVVVSNTQITLFDNWPGTTQAAAPYKVLYTPDDPFTQQLSRQVMQKLSDSALIALSGLPAAARKGIRFGATSTAETFDLSDYMVSLMGNGSAAALYSALGVVPNAQLPTRLRQDATDVTDCNTIVQNGFYFTTNTAANAPQADYGWLLVMGRGAGTQTKQIWWAFGSARSMMRQQNSTGVWGGWVDATGMTHSANTSSAILRLASGFKIQAASSVITSNVNGQANIAYPEAYVTAPQVIAWNGDGNVQAIPNQINAGNSTTLLSIQLRDYAGAAAVNTPFRLNWVAFGA